jgi:quercetin dioxygenase-like cupin family protein
MMGVTITFLLESKDTNGQSSLLEYTAPPQFKGPAPHYHKQATEAFYILEGELHFAVAGKARIAKAGEFVPVAPRTVHAWSNPNDTPCRFLVLFTPGGSEGYFDALQTLMREETTWPPADMSKVMALAEQFDTFSPPAP